MYEKIRLSPGLLVLRLASPKDGKTNAALRPIVPLASRGAINLMFDPGTPTGILTRTSNICVIRVARPAVLLLEITAAHGSGEPRGGIELDYLVHSEEVDADPPSMADFTVYVDQSGDRPARFGDWVGDEAGERAIIGAMLPQRLIGPRIMLKDPRSDQIAAPGEFLGSRSGFRALSALQIWIDEPDGRYWLKAQADFARAGRVEAVGSALFLQGTGEDDRLIRLCLDLQAREPEQDLARPVPRRNRVRIFRKDDLDAADSQ